MLGDKVTKADLDAFAGKSPDHCLPSKPGFELCEWRLSNREADPVGTPPNELTASEDRDEFAGTPWHKSVPARLTAL